MEDPHKAYSTPGRSWAMRQTWRDLLFAHWPLPPDALRPLVPPLLGLDTVGGRAWLGIVPFRMTGVRLRWIPPLPWTTSFAEMNVRTYVTWNGRPGVYFLSLDAGNPLAVEVARRAFRLPYVGARVACHTEGEDIVYSSERRDRRLPLPAALELRYRPAGASAPAEPGSLVYWLTERYCLYVTGREGVLRGEVSHEPWRLQPATAEIRVNTMATAAGVALPDEPPLLHFARALDVRLSWLEACGP